MPLGNYMFLELEKSSIRQQLLGVVKNGVVTKVIPFRNNDVPEYLRRLADLEAVSKRVRITVR
jgi:hypothetical protein